MAGSSKRLKLQLQHIEDMIKEQNRMVLADVEPTDSDRADMLLLLQEVKSTAEHDGRQAVDSISSRYSEICTSLSELGYNVSPYNLVVPVEEVAPVDSSIVKPRKQVHFEDDEGSVAVDRSSPSMYLDNEAHREASVHGSFADDSEFSSTQVYDQNNLLLEDQDRRLNQIGVSVGRQRAMGEDINTELEYHNNLLEDMESQVDRSQGRLSGLTNGVRNFNKRSRDCGVCSTILLLVLILFIVIII